MSRRRQLEDLRVAEAALAERRLALHDAAGARARDLRRLHPAWLLVGGFTGGVIVHRIGGSTVGSSLLLQGLRLSRLAGGDLLSSVAKQFP